MCESEMSGLCILVSWRSGQIILMYFVYMFVPKKPLLVDVVNPTPQYQIIMW